MAWSSAEEGRDGGHAPVLVSRLGEAELLEDWVVWASTVRSVTNGQAAMARLDMPSAINPRDIDRAPGRALAARRRGLMMVEEVLTDSSYAVGQAGAADGPTVVASSGATPYGFDFTRTGVLVVTEAAGG